MDNFNQIKERCCTHLVEHAENEEITLRQENGEVVERKTDEKHSYSQDIKKATFSCDIIYCDENGDKLFIKEDETPLYQNIREGVITPNVSEYFKCLDYNEKKFERISSKAKPSNCKYVPNIDVDINNIVTDKDKYNILYWSIYDNQGRIDSSKQKTIETPVDIIKYSGNKIAVVCKKEESAKVPYYGPMHYSSNGLNLIGMQFYAESCQPCVADNGSMVAITEPSEKIIPVINWNMQYDLSTDSTYGTNLEGLTFDTYTSPTSEVKQNKLYVKGTKSSRNSVAGFCISGKGGYTKAWESVGGGAYKTDWENNVYGQIVAIISITPNKNFEKAGWHFHVGKKNVIYTLTWNNITGRMNATNLPKFKKNGDKLEETTEDFYFAPNTYYALLDSADAGYLTGIRKLDDNEVANYITDSVSVESEATGNDDTITFSITVNGSNVTSTVNKSDLPTSVVIDEDTSTYTCTVAINDLQDKLLYEFTQDCILDIDEHSPYKNIFKIGQQISLPYYSGCTFVPYNS